MDSPTSSRGVRISLACIATHRWTVNIIDIKTAFLQGKTIERTIHVRPPKEATTSKIWKLRKAVYGLADANRTWYLKICEELIKLSVIVSKINQGIFYWKEKSKLKGKAICFADDLIWAGNKSLQAIITKLKKTFQVGTENTKSFKNIGIHINQNDDKSITVNRESETYDICKISTTFKSAIIADIKAINKVARFVTSIPNSIMFPRLDPESTSVKMFADASNNNLPNGSSQGGCIVFLSDKSNNSCAVAWKSQRFIRAARSTWKKNHLPFQVVTQHTDLRIGLGSKYHQCKYKNQCLQ